MRKHLLVDSSVQLLDRVSGKCVGHRWVRHINAHTGLVEMVLVVGASCFLLQCSNSTPSNQKKKQALEKAWQVNVKKIFPFFVFSFGSNPLFEFTSNWLKGNCVYSTRFVKVSFWNANGLHGLSLLWSVFLGNCSLGCISFLKEMKMVSNLGQYNYVGPLRLWVPSPFLLHLVNPTQPSKTIEPPSYAVWYTAMMSFSPQRCFQIWNHFTRIPSPII